jgi:uncharacterized protein GlcG (DUF336 family)
VTKSLPFTEQAIRRAIAAARKEGIVICAVTVHQAGRVTVYQQGGIVTPASPEQNRDELKWLDVEA